MKYSELKQFELLIKRKVYYQFKKLGNNQEIYNYFLENKICGYRCDAYNCPIAIFIIKKLKFESVTANFKTISIFIGKKKISFATPKNISNFMKWFDLGYFPEITIHMFGSTSSSTITLSI